MQESRTGNGEMGEVAHAAATLRDGVLQDLIAISIMLNDIMRSLTPGEESESVLRKAVTTLEDDLAELRQLIRSLEAADTCGHSHE